MAKTRTIKPTARQKLAFSNMSEIVGTGGTIKSALLKSGYSKEVAENPAHVIQSKGFQQLCDECGMTDDFLISALMEDIRLMPQNRSRELGIAFKIKGKMVDKAETHTFQHITISDADFKDIISAYKRK